MSTATAQTNRAMMNLAEDAKAHLQQLNLDPNEHLFAYMTVQSNVFAAVAHQIGQVKSQTKQAAKLKPPSPP